MRPESSPPPSSRPTSGPSTRFSSPSAYGVRPTSSSQLPPPPSYSQPTIIVWGPPAPLRSESALRCLSPPAACCLCWLWRLERAGFGTSMLNPALHAFAADLAKVSAARPSAMRSVNALACLVDVLACLVDALACLCADSRCLSVLRPLTDWLRFGRASTPGHRRYRCRGWLGTGATPHSMDYNPTRWP